MPNINLRKVLISTSVLSLFLRPSLAIDTSTANNDSTASQYSTERNQSQTTTNSQERVPLKSAPEWLTHATLSYREWQQGDVIPAIREGEEAVRINPNNSVALINLALLKQRAKDYMEAISLYWQAAQLLPDSWVPPLGIARCYVLSNDEANSRDILSMMSELNDCDFNWYYMTAKTWLEIDNPSMAAETASRAAKVATQKNQKVAAEILQLLALLRAGKTEQAKSLQDQVFRNDAPRNPELYVRSALALIPPNDPAAGSELLSRAIENLSGTTDGDVFLKLGIVFQRKSDDSKGEQSCRASWLKNAQESFAQAIAISPKSPDPHFALASAYSSEGESLKAADELKKYASFARNDIIAPFLISKLLASEARTSDPIPVNLSLVKFKIIGLNCSCHLARIHGVLRKMPGVAFISTPPQKPFSGIVLVDKTLTPVQEMLAQCSKDPVPSQRDAAEKPEKIELELTSDEPVKSVSDALRVAGAIRFGPILSFERTYSDYISRFQEVVPIMPVSDDSTEYGVMTASTWNAPL